MEPREEQAKTDIVEEPLVTPQKPKGKRRPWLLAGLPAVFLMAGLAIGYLAVRPQRMSLPGPTAEDLEQQKYDAEQRQREDQKAAQLRNEPYLVPRKITASGISTAS